MSTKTDDYKNFVDLLAVFSQANANLTAVEARVNEGLLEAIDADRAEFAQAQSARDQAEEAVKKIAADHPEWCEGRTITTPYGAVSFRKTSKLEVANPKATLALIRAHFSADGAKHKPATFIVVEENIDLEALEALDDATLGELGVSRLRKDVINVKPAAVDMGKATRPKAEKPAKAA